MLKGETYCWSCSACGTPANGIHNHEHGPTPWSKKPVHIFGSPCFFHAILGEIDAHWSDELFGVGHDLILHRDFRSGLYTGAPLSRL
jgi:hypothetical protein